MNLPQSAESEEEPTENTRLMSETVAMENRAYHTDHGDSGSADNWSQPAVIIPSTETVS